MGFMLVLWVYYMISNNVLAAENTTYDISNCCKTVLGSCRESCENLSLVQLATMEFGGREPKLANMKRMCSSSLVEFWSCMDNTLDAVAKGSQWSGRPCCSSAFSLRCQNACATASSKQDVRPSCRQSDEQTLFTCLDKQETGENCCGSARSSECLQTCRSLFLSKSAPTQNEVNKALIACNDSHPMVSECIKNLAEVDVDVNLKQYLPCCDQSSNKECRSTCRKFLESSGNMGEVINAMEIGGCGTPHPADSLWACFLSSRRKSTETMSSTEVSRINQIGMDSAKLHCCYKAIAPKCQRLCNMTFSNDWTESKDNFDSDCLTQITEVELKQCMDEVDEPCELGCDGLSFCTNFNNRPTELFRSCNAEADAAAQMDFNLWQAMGIIRLPGLEMPIRNISLCSPEIWKAIACTLQIKPCTRGNHANLICRDDCFDILSKCLDWTRMTSVYSSSALCKKLSIEDLSAQCVSLKPYLEPSDIVPETYHITSPCRSFPCNSSQVCEVNRNHDIHGKKYTCQTGCPLGEASPYLVPIGTYVRIPSLTSLKGCLKICRCGKTGRLEKCQPIPCVTDDSCRIGTSLLKHGTWSYVECNICSCFSGENTCTKKQCRIPGLTDDSYTGLPCNCPPHFVPVCGKNGMTYPSACVAKCNGLQDIDYEFGPCRSMNPCTVTNCTGQSICIVDYQVCLSGMHKPCSQHQCANMTQAFCNHSGFVCDINGNTHSSLCHMIKSKSQLAYHGHCLKGCQNIDSGSVCGINGITYRSECEAWSDYSYVDYKGICKEIGYLNEVLGDRCNTIICAPLSVDNCQQIIPPGACCPICAGAIRIVYSRKQIDRALYALNGQDKRPVTLKSILKSLENLIQVAQCRLIGYITIEADIFVAILPTHHKTTALLMDTCVRESEKIAALISTQSHRITSELGLSALTVATLVPPIISKASAVIIAVHNQILLILILIFVNILLSSR